MFPLLKAADSSEAVVKMSDDSCGLLGTTIVEVGQQVHNVDLEIPNCSPGIPFASRGAATTCPATF